MPASQSSGPPDFPGDRDAVIGDNAATLELTSAGRLRGHWAPAEKAEKTNLARSEGFEPPALGIEIRCSIQLSYERLTKSTGRWKQPDMCRLPHFCRDLQGGAQNCPCFRRNAVFKDFPTM